VGRHVGTAKRAKRANSRLGGPGRPAAQQLLLSARRPARLRAMMPALEELFRANQENVQVRMEYATHVYFGRWPQSDQTPQPDETTPNVTWSRGEWRTNRSNDYDERSV